MKDTVSQLTPLQHRIDGIREWLKKMGVDASRNRSISTPERRVRFTGIMGTCALSLTHLITSRAKKLPRTFPVRTTCHRTNITSSVGRIRVNDVIDGFQIVEYLAFHLESGFFVR